MAEKARVVDKWKMKSWYSIIAPEIFESKEIGQLVSGDETNIINRKITVGLGELTGSFSQASAYTTLELRVKEVKGKSAFTKFIGHFLAPGYVRTLMRRRRCAMHQVDDVVTKDGVPLRVKTVAISGLKVSEAVRADVRKKLSAAVNEFAKTTDFSTFVQEMIFGKLSAKLFNAIKKIGPMKRVEVRKSELKETFEAAAA